MRFLRLFPLMILFLAACSGGGAPQARYEPPGKPGGRMCVFQCRNGLDHCEDACTLKERGCMNEMQGQAIRDYESYAREQFQARAPVELRLRDFERPEQCFPAACRSACADVYDECFVKCGGKIVSGAKQSVFVF